MRFVLALALGLTTTACPGDDDSGSGPSLAPELIGTAFHDAYCQYLVRCGYFADRATCNSARVTFEFSFEPAVLDAIRAGRARYNVENVRACLDAWAQRSCDTTSLSNRDTDLAVCRQFVTGTVAAQETCFVDEECISQSCSNDQTLDACVGGSCIGDAPPSYERVPIGQPCFPEGTCVNGAWCDPSMFNCAAVLPEGSPCGQTEQCEYGLGCAGPTGARTCRPLPAEGEPCPDLVCRDDGQYCSTAGICTRIGLAGAACTSNLECSTYYPCAGGACMKGPALGEPCASSSAGRCFDVDSFCDVFTLTCSTPQPDGGRCSNDDTCVSGYCDRAVSQCAPAPACT